MNYRHAFHAGNFADVVKHAVLCRIIDYLQRKPKAFRVIDTHSGAGLYALTSPEAHRSGEWRDGIGRLMAAEIRSEAKALLQPYLDAIDAAGGGDALSRYPGSPRIVRGLMRKQDRLTAIELHPAEARRLKGLFEGDHQVRVIELDGWLALGAQLPPKEKRGLVFVDPPYEEDGEFGRLVDGLVKAYRRWPGGIYAFWYPIKDRKAVALLAQALRGLSIPRILDVRFLVRPFSPEPRLDGSGMIVVNPPFMLEGELRVILPALRDAIAEGEGGDWSIDWLAGEPRHA